MYSVFNLVYETNVASIRIWDALGFKRIGRVKGAGNLRSSPHELVGAIIYGRDLGPESADFVSDERFEKIRFYLKHGKYPNGADRAEKSRLRSAATHYKLLPAEDEDERASGRDTERLMLKDKEVVADPQRQYEIAQRVHAHHHAGINKSTAIITEKYHWVRIKETVSLVIKNCAWCQNPLKPQPVRPAGDSASIDSFGSSNAPRAGMGDGALGRIVRGRRGANGATAGAIDPNSMIERMVDFEDPQLVAGAERNDGSSRERADPRLNNRRGKAAAAGGQMTDSRDHGFDYSGLPGPTTVASFGSSSGGLQSYPDIPVDPLIMQGHLHSRPLVQDIRSGGFGNDDELMGSRTLIPPSPANALPMIPSVTHNPFVSDPCTTGTAPASSSPMTLYDPHQIPAPHQQYLDPDEEDVEDDENAHFEPDLPPELLLSHQPHNHHRHQAQHPPHSPIRVSHPHPIDEDGPMDFDPTLDAEDEEQQHEGGAFDHLNLHVNDDHDDGVGHGNEDEDEDEDEHANRNRNL